MNTLLKMKIAFPSPTADDKRVTALPAPAAPSAGGGSTDPRQFIAQLAREKRLRARNRRLKRVGLALVAVGAAAGWMVTDARRSTDSSPAALSSTAESTTAPAVVEERAPAPAPLTSPTAEAQVPPDVVAPQAALAAAAVAAAAPSQCEQDFSQRLWRAATDSCEAAFTAAPDAATALKVAHANYARGRVRNAGKWASTAVELGTTDADAFVLIGHSERRAGHDDAAMRAYRRYLQESPNGWHARDVRAALRVLRNRSVSTGEQTSAPDAHLVVR